MSPNEFRQLQKGNKIRFVYAPEEVYTISLAEQDYDYSTRPAARFTWQVHFSGYTLQVADTALPFMEIVQEEKE